MSPPKGSRVVRINAILQAQLIKLLLEGTYSCQELADMTGLCYDVVLRYTRELHRAGAAHIGSWNKDSRGRDAIKVYKLGEGRDARKQVLTDRERSALYRVKKKQIALLHALTMKENHDTDDTATDEETTPSIRRETARREAQPV